MSVTGIGPLLRVVTLLMRLDIAASMAIAAGLLFWLTWHS